MLDTTLFEVLLVFEFPLLFEDVPLLPSFESVVVSEEPLPEPEPDDEPLVEPNPFSLPELPDEEPLLSSEEGVYFSTVSFR